MLHPHVLIVEDDDKTRLSVADGLQREGWNVTTVSSCSAALSAMDSRDFDLLFLDWMLPDGDGLSLLKHAKQRGQSAPVLMLTARDTLEDRVVGLDEGADDYLVKPFAFPELLARGRALLRRPLVIADNVLRCDDLELDTRSRVAHRAGEEINLTPREVDILDYLMRRQGHIVSREMLQREVWKELHRFSSLNNVIDVQIMRLRKKIDPAGAVPLIHTVRGLGYRVGRGGS